MIVFFLNEKFIVVDFFVGIGNVGIEFLLRGVKEVIFVEKDMRCINLIKENFKNLDLLKRVRIIKGDVLKFLKFKNCLVFDIIFLDLLYRFDYVKECIFEIIENNRINENGFIIVEFNLEFWYEDENFFILREREYGDIKIIIFCFGGKRS